MVRIFPVLVLSSVVALAQDQPTPSPTPQASPAATPAVAPAATPETPAPATEAAPSPDASPAASPDATPASAADGAPAPALEPSATPAADALPPLEPTPASSDVIPMEGMPTAPLAPSEGVPLDTQDLSPALPSGNIPDAAFTDPNAIIPDEAPAPPAMPVAVESAQEKARELTIRYRDVRVQADKDPKVLRMFERSNEAKTDEDKRAALREYYRLLFAKMVSIDKSLEERCRTMEQAYLRRLAQERLEPTIPLNPPPTPEPLTP